MHCLESVNNMAGETDIHSYVAEPRRDQFNAGESPAGMSLCLVGGKRIFRQILEHYLRTTGVDVLHACVDEKELGDFLVSQAGAQCDAVFLVLAAGPFGTFHRISETLDKIDRRIPLVVLSEQASRGQVYTALRIGAKAYVNLDAEPEELLKALKLAGQNKVYLAPDAAELLANDISGGREPGRGSRPPRTELSRRETEVIQLLCEGLSSKEIARHLHISAKTVENHRYNIYRKCEVDSVAALMRHAIQRGLVTI